MGFGLRLKEKVKQVGKKSSQPDKNGFVATDYQRVQLTYDEAVDFAESLKTIRKRIADAHSARTKMLKDIEKTLTGSLPRIHEIDPVTGEHSTQEAAAEEYNTPGDYVHRGTLTRLAEENEVKVQQQVYDPIDRWISEVDLFKGKMKILENLRLELDGSRRGHINIENKIAKQEAKQNEVDAKHTTHIQSKDASVAGKRTAYEQYEAQVYEELTQLISETGVLHTALDRAIKLEIDIYQKAADPISTTTARLETLSTSGGSGLNTPTSSVPASVPGGPAGAGYAQSGYGTSQGAGYGSSGAGSYGATGAGSVPTYGATTTAGGYGTGTGASTYGTGTGASTYGTGAGTGGVSSGTGTGGVYYAETVSPKAGAGGENVAYERPYAA